MNAAMETGLNYALYLVFPIILVPLFAASLGFRIYPTKRAALVFIVVALASSGLFLFGEDYFPKSLVFSLDAIFFLVFILDAIAAIRLGRDVVITRRAESVVSLDQPFDVELIVENRSRKPIAIEVIDDSRQHSQTAPARAEDDLLAESDEELYRNSTQNFARFPRRIIPANESETLSYRLIWRRRGVFRFEFVGARFLSRVGFWCRFVNYPVETTFQVYPNLCQLEQFQALGRASLLFLLGVRQMRRVGQDAEFERLRDYSQDDQYKFIDWKATARRNKLIVRDFQTTRNQRVIIMIDAGRTMMNLSNGATLYDAALNATLALAYIALKQGDEVGFLVFSKEIRRFVPPRGGMRQMNALIRGVFDVFPERCDSRYDKAFEYLLERSPKRALLVLATNALDERNTDLLERSMLNLSGAHLPLGLFLREHSLFDAVERYEASTRVKSEDVAAKGEPKKKNRLALWIERFSSEREPVDEIERLFWRDATVDDANEETLFYRAGAACEILNWRKKTLRALEAKGAPMLDVFPEDAAAPLINKYLEIKARRLL